MNDSESKIISVRVVQDGVQRIWKRKLSSDDMLQKWFSGLGVDSFVDPEGVQQVRLTDIKANIVYDLGPPVQHSTIHPSKYSVKLRPWLGYGEVEPVQVDVSSVEELKKEALRVVVSNGCAPRKVVLEQIKLYHCELGENGLPVDSRTRRPVFELTDLSRATQDSGGVVWVWISEGTKGKTSSPQWSPQDKKPQSPFIVAEHANTLFVEIPEIYKDKAVERLKEAWMSKRVDPYVQFILAIPGSGKSRTVQVAAEELELPHCRVKFLEGAKLQTIKDRISSLLDDQGHVFSYEGWKLGLGELIRSILDKELKKMGLAKESHAILHIDEIQTVMGSTEITPETWDDEQDPFDMIMPALCSKLVEIMHEYPHLRCVLTGTNFFANLVLSPGSAVKPDFIDLGGTFPAEWVMEALIRKYFCFPEFLMKALLNHVEFLRWNRRAIHHFLVELRVVCRLKKAGDTLSTEELENCRSVAFDKWSGPISKALQDGKASILAAMALIVFPEAYNGTIKTEKFVFPKDSFPTEVSKFCLAGGLNMSVAYGAVSIAKPGGCVLGYLSSLTSNALRDNSLQEVNAFTTVSKSVDTEKGHLFERVVAAELSMLSEGKSPMYSQFQRLWRGDGELVPDPLVFGRAFEYKSTILQDLWKEHQVYCVSELPKDNGNRKVDVGFPILRHSSQTNKPMQVLCELKKGYTTSDLWKLCWKFFTEMEETVDARENVIACFMTSDPFLDSEPRQSPTKKKKSNKESKTQREDTSTHDSRKNALKLVKSNPRYMIFENAKQNSLFPLEAMLKGDNVEQCVSSINDTIERRYVGSQS